MTITDRTVSLDVNGSTQRIRVRSTRDGLPILLVVQAGPGLSLLNEVPKFERLLRLETEFLVAYWDQRGCGDASRHDATSVSWRQQIEDLRTVLRWVHRETGQAVNLLGISLGATISLLAAALEPERVRSIVAISLDADIGASDASVQSFLRDEIDRSGGRYRQRLERLAPPPYLEPRDLQQRARLLADLGAIERRKNFNALLHEMLVSSIRAYGLVGTFRSLRNMNLIQAAILPELARLDLLADPPRVAMPVHFVLGGHDPLVPASISRKLAAAIAAPRTTVTMAPDAGHMVHFDEPELVRTIVVEASREP
jgi:pimeloyl-ACP methyl ester carboxylesterase